MISNNDMVMPVAPMVGGYGNGGAGFGGDWSSWIILFLIFAMFGNGGWGGNNGGANGNVLYPWLNQSDQVNNGFRDQMINSTINGIQNGVTTGFGDVQNSLCAGFAGVNAAINSSNTAALERSFAAQTANTQGLFNLQSQLSQCCCDNRLATAQTQALIQSENCADRAAISDGLRDIIANNNAQTQAILDKLCTLELDGYKRENENLRTQLNMQALAASQEAQTNQLISRLAPNPTPAYVVANPNGCAANCGCGYGVA